MAPQITSWADYIQWVEDWKARRDHERRVRENRPYPDAVTAEEFDRLYPRGE